MRPVGPQPGPQMRFAACPADICVFGGEAGGGKSDALVLEPMKWTHLPGFEGAIFRRKTTDITGPGGLWSKAQRYYGPAGATLVASPTHEARWDTAVGSNGAKGAKVHFKHLIHEWTVTELDGLELAYAGIDEGQYFTGEMIWYIWGRCRTTCGVKPYIRITCNPDPDCYLRTLLDWWIGPDGYPIPERDGVLRWCVRVGEDLEWFDEVAAATVRIDVLKSENPGNPEIEHLAPISVTFIRSRLTDNPALLAADPNYGARLAMQDADSRAKKLGGNWNSRPKPGEMFNPEWFVVLDAVPPDRDVVFKVRAWDKAATIPSDRNPHPDWTRGALLYLLRNGIVVMVDLVGCRLEPGGVDSLIRSTAERDGPTVTQAFWIDGGQSGKVDEQHNRDLLRKVACGPLDFVQETKSKIHYAKLWAAYADPAANDDQRRFHIVRGAWNKEFFSEIVKFPKPKGVVAATGIHDDIVDAVSRAWCAIEARISGVARFLAATKKMR
jgi:phage terminase large subunit-like protein